jgi:hypothetical protein
LPWGRTEGRSFITEDDISNDNPDVGCDPPPSARRQTRTRPPHNTIQNRKIQKKAAEQSTAMTTTTTTATTSSEPATAAVEALVLTAYLKPLVDKHSAQELITYEDLHAAHAAALAKIKSEPPETTPPAADTTMVRDKLRSLHQEQMELYKAAAVAHVQAWAETTAAPTSGSEPVLPNWKLVPKSVLEAAKRRVAERAAAAAVIATATAASSAVEDSAMTEAAAAAAKEDAVVEMEEAAGEEGEVEGGTNSDEPEPDNGEGTPVVDESLLENSTSDLPVTAAEDESSPPPQEEEKSSSKAAATTTTAAAANKGKGGILAKSRARAGKTTTTMAAPPAKKKPLSAKSPAPGGGGKRGGRGAPIRKARAAPSK